MLRKNLAILSLLPLILVSIAVFAMETETAKESRKRSLELIEKTYKKRKREKSSHAKKSLAIIEELEKKYEKIIEKRKRSSHVAEQEQPSEKRNKHNMPHFKFQCNENDCTYNTTSVYKHSILAKSRKHLETNHRDLYRTDESIEEKLANSIKGPEKILKFSLECIDEDCTTTLTIYNKGNVLIQNLCTHILRIHGYNVKRTIIAEHYDKHLKTELVKNPYFDQNTGKFITKLYNKIQFKPEFPYRISCIFDGCDFSAKRNNKKNATRTVKIHLTKCHANYWKALNKGNANTLKLFIKECITEPQQIWKISIECPEEGCYTRLNFLDPCISYLTANMLGHLYKVHSKSRTPQLKVETKKYVNEKFDKEIIDNPRK